MSNWKDATNAMNEQATTIVYCEACKVSRRVLKSIKDPVCGCGRAFLGVQKDPPKDDATQEMEQDRWGTL
jgi:hypothetical protein